MVHDLIMPRLGLADLQSLGQACRATLAIVASLPDVKLAQLVKVCTGWVSEPYEQHTERYHPRCGAMAGSLSGLRCSQSANNRVVVQDQHLPARVGHDLREQLHSWARHVAAVQGGSLHLDREFYNLPITQTIMGSDSVAAHMRDLHCAKVAALPAARASVDLQQLLAYGSSIALEIPEASRLRSVHFRCGCLEDGLLIRVCSVHTTILGGCT